MLVHQRRSLTYWICSKNLKLRKKMRRAGSTRSTCLASLLWPLQAVQVHRRSYDGTSIDPRSRSVPYARSAGVADPSAAQTL
jgi:hypothetical protein